jgi:hypothetical protein
MFGIVSLVDFRSKPGFLDAARGGRHLARNRKAASLEVHATGAGPRHCAFMDCAFMDTVVDHAAP